jgi:hypothetical protein
MRPIKIFIRKPIGELEIKRRIDLALKMLNKMNSPLPSVTELDVGRALLGGIESRKPWIDDTTTSCVAEFTELDDIMHFNQAFYYGKEDEIKNYFASQKKDYEISNIENIFYTQAEIALFMINDNWWSGCYGYSNKFSIEEIVGVYQLININHTR